MVPAASAFFGKQVRSLNGKYTNLVDEIKTRCNIVDLVGQYVRLKRTGGSYKGLCPFHTEKTPSFNVNEKGQFYHCFGCGESGDVIRFIEKIENLDFTDAVKKLADMYGLDMNQYGYGNESGKNEVYGMNREAAAFFFQNLTSKANPGYSYMKRRGLDPKTITRFGIGYAEASWDALIRHLESKGYTREEMFEAGLVSRSESGDRYYDKFRNRVMFPIINTRGKVIGFGGRALEDRGPKYLNSPESAVFSKKNNLYGLNLTRKTINEKNEVVVVEGYMDLVSLYQFGITNVVATLGTALTENQCRLLKRYTENVILSYDADAAGRQAALRGIELLRGAGLKARVLHVTDGKDPDEFIRKNGSSEFRRLMEGALPYGDYRIEALKEQYDLTSPEESIDFLQAAGEVLRSMRPVEADVYIRKIAKETGISEGAIRKEALDSRYSAETSSRAVRRPEGTENGRQIAGDRLLQMQLIKLLTVNPDYLEPVVRISRVFEDPAFFRIFQTISEIFREDPGIDIKVIKDSLSVEDAGLLQDVIDTVLFPKDSDQILRDCIRKVERREMERRQNELIQLLNLCGDKDEMQVITRELMTVQSKLQSME